MRGVTGVIKLNSYGYREDFELDIVNLQRDGLKKIGIFNSTQQFTIDWEPNEKLRALAEKGDLYNKTFRVLIALVRKIIGKSTNQIEKNWLKYLLLEFLRFICFAQLCQGETIQHAEKIYNYEKRQRSLRRIRHRHYPRD